MNRISMSPQTTTSNLCVTEFYTILVISNQCRYHNLSNSFLNQLVTSSDTKFQVRGPVTDMDVFC